MYRVVIDDEYHDYPDLSSLRDAFGTRSTYTPDCGTRGDILIRHPFNPDRVLRAMLIDSEEGA